MATTCGKYELDNTDGEKLDAYLKNLGVGLVLRKVLTTSKPTLTINYACDLDEWTISTETPFKSHVCRFQTGQKFEDTTFDARKCLTTGEISEDGKIVLQQECEEGPDVTVVNEKVGQDSLRVTMTAGNMSTYHLYKKTA